MRKFPVLTAVIWFVAAPLFATQFPVEFIPISKSLIIHRSYEMYDGYKTPSNGLIVINENSVLIIDTAWNDQETTEIIDYIKARIGKRIIACIITHSHQDRSGGLGVIAANAIPIFMTSKTSELLGSKYQCTVPVDGMNAFDSRKVDIGYFGPAHTPDNIVVYLPDDRVLFGGCMVKSMASMNAGNTQDADMRNWPKAISGLLGKYRDATQVVPGHGEPGGLELLHHTLDLLK